MPLEPPSLPHPRPHVFLSYSRKDLYLAKEIRRRLVRARVPVWLDMSDVQVGRLWVDEIEHAIEQAGCLVLLASPESCASDWVEREVRFACEHQRPVFPVLVAGDVETSIRAELRTLQCLDLRERPLSSEDIGRLIRVVQGHVPPEPLEAPEIENELQFPDMVAEHIFLGARALRKDELRARYRDEPVVLPPQLHDARERHLARVLDEADRRGQTVDNNLSYSLHGLVVAREQDETGARHNVYTLTTRPTDFLHFVFPNLALDEPIEVQGRATTAREELCLGPERLRLENLPSLRGHFRIGTGAVLITGDNQVVISVRSEHQLIVGGKSFHLSTAEGMLRPVDAEGGAPSPFQTCRRALADELGLQSGEHYLLDEDVRCIAIGMDTLRAQPYFVFFVRTPATSFDTVKSLWLLTAPDRHENKDIVGRPWTADTARALSAGQLPYYGETLQAASNHARFGYTIAALHEFGPEVVGEPRPS